MSGIPQKSGFTLVEIMIVVVIIGLIVTMAIPSFRIVRERSQNSSFISDLRVFKGAVQQYALEVGTFPAGGSPGVPPASFSDYIMNSKYAAASPIGGNWHTIADERGVDAAIGVENYIIGTDQLVAIDELIDDGSTTTGFLRSLGADTYYWIIEE